MADNNNEIIVHETTTFRVVKVPEVIYLNEDNWLVIHNLYNTIEYASQSLLEALTVAEHYQWMLDTKAYIKTEENSRFIKDVIKTLENKGVTILSFNPDKANDDDTTIN